MIVKKYRWKELTKDGLLKEPDRIKFHDGTVSLNDYDGFKNKSDAYESLKKISDNCLHLIPTTLTLFTEYRCY